MHPSNAVDLGDVRPEFLIGLVMRALAEEVAVEVGEDAMESIRILELPEPPVAPLDLEPITEIEPDRAENALEETLGVEASRFDRRIAARDDPHTLGARHERADREELLALAGAGMWAEDGERVAVVRAHDGEDVLGAQHMML